MGYIMSIYEEEEGRELRCIDCDASSYDTCGFIDIDKYTCESCCVVDDKTGEQ